MIQMKMKWNESGFRPPLCTYRLNWARRTSWGWWDDWDDTVLQTQDSKFEPWRSEAEHATSRSRRLPTILTFTRGWGRNNFVSFKPPRPGTEPRTLAWKAAVLTTTLGPPPLNDSTAEPSGSSRSCWPTTSLKQSKSLFNTISKSCNLWIDLTYTPLSVFTLTLLTTPSEPGKSSETRPNGHFNLGIWSSLNNTTEPSLSLTPSNQIQSLEPPDLSYLQLCHHSPGASTHGTGLNQLKRQKLKVHFL